MGVDRFGNVAPHRGGSGKVWYHIVACIRGGRFDGETQISRGDAWLLPNCYKVIIVTVMIIFLAFVSPYIIYIQCIMHLGEDTTGSANLF